MNDVNDTPPLYTLTCYRGEYLNGQGTQYGIIVLVTEGNEVGEMLAAIDARRDPRFASTQPNATTLIEKLSPENLTKNYARTHHHIQVTLTGQNPEEDPLVSRPRLPNGDYLDMFPCTMFFILPSHFFKVVEEEAWLLVAAAKATYTRPVSYALGKSVLCHFPDRTLQNFTDYFLQAYVLYDQEPPQFGTPPKNVRAGHTNLVLPSPATPPILRAIPSQNPAHTNPEIDSAANQSQEVPNPYATIRRPTQRPSAHPKIAPCDTLKDALTNGFYAIQLGETQGPEAAAEYAQTMLNKAQTLFNDLTDLHVATELECSTANWRTSLQLSESSRSRDRTLENSLIVAKTITCPFERSVYLQSQLFQLKLLTNEMGLLRPNRTPQQRESQRDLAAQKGALDFMIAEPTNIIETTYPTPRKTSTQQFSLFSNLSPGLDRRERSKPVCLERRF